MEKVRMGIIGIGNMGSAHCKSVMDLDNCTLAAVCDTDPAAFARLPAECRDSVKKYTDPDEFFRDGNVDAVIVAVPHYDHAPLGIKALQAGKHILVEKPLSPSVGIARTLLDEGKKHPELVQSAMLQLRTMAAFRTIKHLLDQQELGTLTRINWIVTTWFRTQYYYDSGDWRASWRGEGGGVLLNQCPHQLDLLQWLFGMPSRVHAFATIGKFHDIEVEDEVNAYLEYPNGATGIFVTTTGEAPGTNRLEIAGSRGRLVYENGELKFRRNEVDAAKYIRESNSAFGVPAYWDVTVPFTETVTGARHHLIIRNFANAIRQGEKLIAPLPDALNELEIGNAMLYSGLNHEPVTLPLDEKKYDRMLSGLIAKSRYVKKVASGGSVDMNASLS